MSNERNEPELAMGKRDRDVLVVLRGVMAGRYTQAEAGRLLHLGVRQVRRKLERLVAEGDGSVVHGLRGRPSNRRCGSAFRKRVLAAYRRKYEGFGPTFAGEKLTEEGLAVDGETLRRWLMAEGLWERKRRRDPHRSRRERRPRFGELVQMDASVHDWLEGRGETLVLVTMIDDATSRVLARFYPGGTLEAHLDLLGRWLRRHGRPGAVYTDRHSLFEVHDRGQAVADPDAKTQFGRALDELGVALIRAHSPQAKGRVERSFGTAQDRWVKELRLAKARTCGEANAVLERLLPEHNRRFARPPRETSDFHRPLTADHPLASILSVRHERVVGNDYVVRFGNRFFQLLPPVHAGERGGRVTLECRLDGSLAIRFGGTALQYRELSREEDGHPGQDEPTPPDVEVKPATSGRKPKLRMFHPWR